MDEIEVQPREMSGTIEGSEGVAAQKLDDATFEPRAFVEQSGDYQQAEAVQNNFTAVVDNVLSQTNEASGVMPLPATAVETGNKEVVGDCPLPIPSPIEEIGQKNSLADTTSVGETPLPATAVETGNKEVVGDCPLPIPSPIEEIGQKNSLADTTSVGETPLPATAVETDNKEVVGDIPIPVLHPAEEFGEKMTGDLPMPLPNTVGELGQNKIENAVIDQMVTRVLDSPSDLTEEQQLKLQESMENENKKFTVVSNIIKDSHDTAKNAVNNIR